MKDIVTTTGGTANVATLEALANTDPIADNFFLEKDADGIIDFSEIDPFSELISIPDDNPVSNT